MNEFYPEIEPYNHFLINVDNQHQVYVEECGNPNGQVVLFIHGGPGGGCSKNDRRFFDPEKYRIVLFDQRGCGRSLPHGCLDNNETGLLVCDIEAIRQALGIQYWHVFGGSWGSTLALVYAQTHPIRVLSLVLRGIFLGRAQDTDWTFSGGGATRIYPDYWQEYLDVLPDGKASVQAAYNLMLGDDKKLAMRVAKAWCIWEIRCCTLIPNQAFVDAATGDDQAWTMARHEAHFMINNCFLSDNQILANCHHIKDIPVTIVHGRFDIVCPFDNAWQLHQALPQSKLVVSEASGHASIETNTKHHLIEATKEMLLLNSYK
ncbi:prolyl aminopeptidase [Psychromonas sp. 14N.309.X.WAT.B.A12]|uniref:prolyl aminopeptidase n=1 Tax=Psychromonas sp. 14N.309.X.WAT.B.A12 TaxID=2998322 RepID=UPI0025B15880|nr:prolyl aminopeptidase [Psychromonas sp. 14N.309.X.WAT.B.A12]MDN2663874.1 prolyl aminopeptidase [Psychromonas sp. 14N.309.X.WAT.B.A12]